MGIIDYSKNRGYFGDQERLEILEEVENPDLAEPNEVLNSFTYPQYKLAEIFDLSFLKEDEYLKPEIDEEFQPSELEIREIEAAYIDVYHKILNYDEFDEYSIKNHIEERRKLFDSLSNQEKNSVYKAIFLYSNNNDPNMLNAMKLTGRETDANFFLNLEKDYGIKIDNAKLATFLFRYTYAIWKINKISEIDNSYYAAELGDIDEHFEVLKDSAKVLSLFKVEATHSARSKWFRSIEINEVILNSFTNDRKTHFEGDGVYAGIFGSYRGWTSKLDEYNEYDENDQDYSTEMATFDIPLADCIPIIVDYKSPKAMVNILSEGLDYKQSKNSIALASGKTEFRNYKFAYENIVLWKIDKLKEVLNVDKVKIYEDQDGLFLSAPVNSEPIIWGAVARALCLYRFVPESEMSKLDQSEIKYLGEW